MSDLYRLTEDGRRLVDEPFMRGQRELPTETLTESLAPLDGASDVDLAALDDTVDAVVDTHSKYDTSMDGALTEDLHRHLDLSRRVAADPGLWHWLTVVRYPGFVRHRWEYASEAAMREKFLGAGSDLYSNALHRLWWIAELTHRGGDYQLTRRVFDNQTLVNRVFDRWFARYRPAVVGLCEELVEQPSRVIDETTREFNHALTTVHLESLDRADTRRLVRDIVSRVE